ncbi:MAG: hypothetical protein WC121_08210 [Candidatus Kapaibacterium sp.]
MKYTSRILFIILTIILATSCGDDTTAPSNATLPYFTINDGNVWYYNSIIIRNGVDSLNRKYKESILEPSIIEGKNCFKYYITEEGEEHNSSDYTYTRTDEDGYYIFFDTFYESERLTIDKLTNVWVKYIDFKQDNWTQFDINIDTLYANNERQRIYFNISGSTIKSEDVKYKGIVYPSFKTIFKMTIEDTLSINEEIISIYNEISGLEITSINGIGIYKSRFMYNGEISNSYKILTDHK